MSYDDLITPPPESVENREDAAARQAVLDRVESIVHEHATFEPLARVSPLQEWVASIRVPFRITAYRYDFDHDTIEREDVDVGTLPIDETDGWVDLSADTYLTFDLARKESLSDRMVEGVDDPEAEVRALALESLVEAVYEALREGRAEKPLTTEVLRRVEVDHESAVEKTDEDPRYGTPTEPTYEHEYETVTYGTARYKVDAIVPPDEFQDER